MSLQSLMKGTTAAGERSVLDLCLASPALARVSLDQFPTCASSAQLLPESLQISSRLAAHQPSSYPSRSRSVPNLWLVGLALARVSLDRFLTCGSPTQLLPEPLQIGSRLVPRQPNSCPSLSKSIPDLWLAGPALARAAPDRFPPCASPTQLLPESLQIGSRPMPH
ncbi:hypothetical protein C4D60_Mb07t10500 [Musa balbisiana]|uniref:Uncharacterized protein n=1 Tax=Musa balbisiana TaxID=52838 RepID=A0A4S8JEY1_MUSBA|nr:hypothetical protein C4D60_Mb07t10500 [Musa balbisiana]